MARLFGLRNVLTRNRQYFNHYRINVLLLLMIIVVNIFLTVLIIKKLMYDSSPSYIATSPSGDVLWRCPLDNRYSENWQKRYCNSQLTDDEVKNFGV